MNRGPERWRRIKGYPDYLVSSRGRVWSAHRKRCLKPRRYKSGYYGFLLCSNGVCREKRINRLVAQAFLENPENLPAVNHIDGDKANNDVSNLEWISHRGNIQHAYRTGLKSKALEADLIEELKGLYATGRWTQRMLAEKYGVSRSTVGEYVRDVPNPRHRERRGKTPPETKREIFRLYSTGEYTQKELGAMFGVSTTSVGKYVRALEAAQ